MPWREVPIVGLAALETGDELDNGVRLHTQKLTVKLETEYVFPPSLTVFLITAVNGTQFLIGSAEAPFPLIQQNTILSSNASENAITELVVNFTSQIPLIKTQYSKNIGYLCEEEKHRLRCAGRTATNRKTQQSVNRCPFPWTALQDSGILFLT